MHKLQQYTADPGAQETAPQQAYYSDANPSNKTNATACHQKTLINANATPMQR